MSRIAAACAGVASAILTIIAPALSQTASEPDGYTRWQLTVPADTKIRINSKFGDYQVPVGYLNGRLSFHQNSFARLNNVSRYDAF
jgi:hypothetical protein